MFLFRNHWHGYYSIQARNVNGNERVWRKGPHSIQSTLGAHVPHPCPSPKKNFGEGKVCKKGRGAEPRAPSCIVVPSPRIGERAG